MLNEARGDLLTGEFGLRTPGRETKLDDINNTQLNDLDLVSLQCQTCMRQWRSSNIRIQSLASQDAQLTMTFSKGYGSSQYLNFDYVQLVLFQCVCVCLSSTNILWIKSQNSFIYHAGSFCLFIDLYIYTFLESSSHDQRSDSHQSQSQIKNLYNVSTLSDVSKSEGRPSQESLCQGCIYANHHDKILKNIKYSRCFYFAFLYKTVSETSS